MVRAERAGGVQSGTGALSVTPENGAAVSDSPVATNPPALTPLSASVLHPQTDAPWKEWTDLDALRALAAQYPDAVADRTFEYYRGGFDLVDVTVPCLHWFDQLGKVRVTTLDVTTAPNVCEFCIEEYESHGQTVKGRTPHLGDACFCGGTKRDKVTLLAGRTFLNHMTSHWYWSLLAVR